MKTPKYDALDSILIALLVIIAFMSMAAFLGLLPNNDTTPPAQTDAPRHRNRKPALQQAPTIDSVCPQWGEVERADYWYRYERQAGTTEDTSALDTLAGWDMSVSNWIGYERGGWLHHPGRIIAQVSAYTADWRIEDAWGAGYRLILIHESLTTEQLVVFVFTSLDEYADANGNYYSEHPCYAALMDRADVAAWFATLDT